MSDDTKLIGWVRAARKAYGTFPVACGIDRHRADDRCGGRQGGYHQAAEGIWIGRHGDRVRYRADAWRVIYVTRGRGRAVGAPRVSEEIEDGDQDSEG